MITNRVSATLSTEDQESVLTAIRTIEQKLPFLIRLSTAERIQLAKLGDKTEAFVRKAAVLSVHQPGLLPDAFVQEMRKDLELWDRLSPVLAAIDQLRNTVDDTVMHVGAEAYAAARTIYAVTKTPFAQASARAASTDLGKRFGRRTRAAAASVEPGNADPPSASDNT
jgi:hypothetical protein